MISSLRERPGYGWVVLSSFTFSYSLIDITAIVTLGLLLPDISDELSLSPSQQGWLASAVLFTNLTLSIPMNWLLSRYHPWRVATLSFLMGALFIYLHGLSPTFTVLILIRVGLGITYLASQAPRTLVVMQWIPTRRIGLANGILFSLIDGLSGLGSIVIPFILVWLNSWRDTMYVWALIALIASLLWMYLGGERETTEYAQRISSQVTSPVASMFKYKEPWLLGVGIAGAVGGRFAINTFWPTFTQEEYSTPVTVAGLVLGALAMVSAAAKLGFTVIPFFARRSYLVWIICGLGLSLSSLGLLFTGSLPLLFLLGILGGISFSFIPSVVTTLYRLPNIKPREVAVAIALAYTLLWVGAALGPLVAGFIHEATDDLQLALVITSTAPLLLTVVGLIMAKGPTHASKTMRVPSSLS